MSKSGSFLTSLKSYPKSFWLLCINMLVFMMSFNMLLPEMNEYLTNLGGEDKKWMILGLWTLAAASARPFSGKIADNISRTSVMYFGTLVSILICTLYPFFITVTGFLFLRLLHGFSTGFHPTGATALIADVVPKGKRGEAMGLFGVMISLGFSGGQAISSPIKLTFGINGLFYAGAILGVVSLFLLFFIKEKNKPYQIAKKNNPNEKLIAKIFPKRDELIAPEVVQPSVIMFVTAMCYGIYLMAVPDFSTHLGMENKGMFYLVNSVFMVITRVLSGKFYDLYGARRNLYWGLLLITLGAVITATSATVFQFLLSSVVFGIGASICSPALFAWTADLANPAYKGRGMSTMFIALEIGIVAGAYLTQMLYNNKPENFIYIFLAVAIICLLGIVYLFFTAEKKIKTS